MAHPFGTGALSPLRSDQAPTGLGPSGNDHLAGVVAGKPALPIGAAQTSGCGIIFMSFALLQMACNVNLMNVDQSHLSTIATGVSTTSVMNPTLTLCLIICPLALVGAGSLFHFHQVVPASVMLAMAIVPLMIACWQLIHFTIKDPSRLQREQHNERMLEIRQRIEIKEGGTIKQVPISTNLTSNPQIVDHHGE